MIVLMWNQYEPTNQRASAIFKVEASTPDTNAHTDILQSVIEEQNRKNA